MKRFGWIVIIFCLAAGLGRYMSSGSGGVRRQNVMLVSLDTLRADHVGAWGYPVPVTPFLDGWSKKCVIMPDVLAQSATTRTSHRAVFTSRYISQQKGIASPPDETWAGFLRNAGYATAAFVDGGKMNRIYGNDPGFDIYDDKGGGFAAILPKVRTWLISREKEKNRTPFFLFIHTYDIHSPYDPPHPYDVLFTGGYRPGFETKGKNPPYYNSLTMSAADYKYLRGLYDGGIRWTDAVLADFFRFLDDTDLLDDTIIVVMSDHGESLGERGRVGHHQLYRTQTHVPLWIYIPGYATGVLGGAVENIDIAPTVLSILGLEPPPVFRGMNLYEMFPESGSKQIGNRYRLTEEKGRAVVSPDGWKYIVRETPDEDELYAMMSDPEEICNRMGRHPRRCTSMLYRLRNILGKTEADVRKPIFHGHIRLGKTGSDLGNQLRALGYVQ